MRKDSALNSKALAPCLSSAKMSILRKNLCLAITGFLLKEQSKIVNSTAPLSLLSNSVLNKILKTNTLCCSWCKHTQL